MKTSMETGDARDRDARFGYPAAERKPRSQPVAVALFLRRDAETGEISGLECGTRPYWRCARGRKASAEPT